MAGNVTVACKWGPGLNLRLGEFIMQKVPDKYGGQTERRIWAASNKSIHIKGPNNAQSNGTIITADGFALTHGVDADLFAKWWADNKDDLDLIKNNLLKYHEKPAEISAVTKPFASQKSGIERLELDDKGRMIDKRVPKVGGMTVQTERIGQLGA